MSDKEKYSKTDVKSYGNSLLSEAKQTPHLFCCCTYLEHFKLRKQQMVGYVFILLQIETLIYRYILITTLEVIQTEIPPSGKHWSAEARAIKAKQTRENQIDRCVIAFSNREDTCTACAHHIWYIHTCIKVKHTYKMYIAYIFLVILTVNC